MSDNPADKADIGLARQLADRGYERTDRGDFAGAASDCDAALRIFDSTRLKDRHDLDSYRARTLVIRGNARRDLRDFSGAIADYSAVLEIYNLPVFKTRSDLDPYRAQIHMNRGDARGSLNDLDGAVVDFDAALTLFNATHLKHQSELDQSRARTYTLRGLAQGHLGKVHQAINDFATALAALGAAHLRDNHALDPGRAQIHVYRAIARQQSDDLAGATTDYDAALVLYEIAHLKNRREFDSERTTAHLNRGIVWATLGDPAKAVADYDAALMLLRAPFLRGRRDLDTDRVKVRTSRAAAQAEVGAYAEAVKDFDAALALYDTSHLSERIDLDPERAQALVNRGTALASLGNFAKATLDYDAALVIYDQSHLRERRDLDPDRATARMNRGTTRESLSDLAGAVADFEAALALYDTPSLRNKHEHDPSRAQIYINRSVVRWRSMDLIGALTDAEAALRLYESPDLKDRHDLDPDRAKARHNRAIVRTSLGNLPGAVSDFDSALAILEATRTKDHGEFDSNRAQIHLNRGVALVELSDPAGAVADFDSALSLFDAPHLKNRCEFDPLRAGAHINRAIVRTDLGYSAEAIADYISALNIFDAPHLKKRRELDSDRARTLVNMAILKWQLHQRAEALAHSQAGEALLDDPAGVGLWRHLDPMRMKVWANMAWLLRLMDDAQEWASERSGRMREVLELAPPWTGEGRDPWNEARVDFARFHAAWLTHCITTGGTDRIPGIVSALQGRELAVRILDELSALEGSGELSPALKAYQDLRRQLREKAEEIRLATERGSGGPLLGDSGASRGMTSLGIGPTRDGPARDGLAREAGFGLKDESLPPHPHDQTLVRRLDEEYRALRGRLADVREAAAREPGYEALVPPQLDAATLAAGKSKAPGSSLAADQALVLFVDLARGADIQGALVLRHSRDPHWIALPGVRELAAEVDAVSERLGSRGASGGTATAFRYAGRRADGHTSQRGGGGVEEVPEVVTPKSTPEEALAPEAKPRPETQSTPVGESTSEAKSPPEDELTSELPTQPETDLSAFWEVMEGRLREQVWRPLEEALAGISQVVCVTQGRLHLLPLELGAPKGKTLRHYPGLVYYGYSRGLLGRNENRQSQSRSHTNSEAASPPPAVGLVGYGGEQDSIPFVWGEVDALKRLHEERHRSVRTGDPYDHRQDGSSPASPTEYALLHLACHGIPVGEGMRERVVLQLGPGRPLDMGRIMESRVKVDQVLIAACLGGKVREDLDGEPSGVVGGYLYRGSSEVAAAVVALPDSWTMLASILIHQAWLESGSLGEAVTEGKRRLAEGDWYPDTERLFSEAANAALTAWRERNRGPLRRRLVHALTYDGNRWKQLVAPLKTAGAPDRYDPSALREGAEGEAWGERIQTVAAEVADRLLDLDPLRHAVDEVLSRRVPPQPLLGAIVYGIRTFGEARPT